jgi:23S rRNA (adenine2030-N6)-methyltransferase
LNVFGCQIYGLYPEKLLVYTEIMLSYRHAFHAGNHADILKHSILARIVSYLIEKEKPFSYIDTHAGAGIYQLDDEWANITGEALMGIRLLIDKQDIPESLLTYVSLCRKYFSVGHRYPGSPEIVRSLSREKDSLTLMELHSSEIDNLRHFMGGNDRIHIHNRDGYSGLLALTPPDPRRGFCLMDPSYETADDYAKTAEAFLAAHAKWPVGILVLWYPILERRQGELLALKDRFFTSGIQGILAAELLIREKTADEDGGGFGLLGSGMLIVQPPWRLEEDLRTMLPYLAETLGQNGKGSWNLEWISEAP